MTGQQGEPAEVPAVPVAPEASGEDAPPLQHEMPFAVVQGTPLTELPRDLYIPPDALEVFLEAFEGPLDLLLYLIKRQNLDILDIPIARITAQYMHYIDLMQELRLELAAEYLVMAAVLAEIKSRMLLPRTPVSEEEDADPRAELVRRLQEYERYKQAAEDLDALPRLGRDLVSGVADFPDRQCNVAPPAVSLDAIMEAFADVVRRASLNAHHHVLREPLSVRERMSRVLESLRPDAFVDFASLFTAEEGRAGAVVTLLALLELLKQSLVEIVQDDNDGPIHVKAAA